MTQETKDQILDALRSVQDPDLHKDIVTLDFVKDLAFCGGAAKFTLELTTPACPVKEELKAQAEAAALSVEGVNQVTVNLSAKVKSSLPAGNQLGGNVRNVIAVTSGKGGVGKSTCAVNLAVALAQAGARVGLLDADIYGPNLPVMLGLAGVPAGTTDGKHITPLEAHGVKMISVGTLVKDGQPVMWRGPMLHRALKQFLQDVLWGELDYLLVDMPPGTGDAQISLAQLVPLTGAVVVTMPQEVSLTDVRRAMGMCQEVKCPILGVVENMSGDIFGYGGGESIAAKYEVPFLGTIPLDPEVRTGGDSGIPLVISSPDSVGGKAFRKIAGLVAAEIAKKQSTELPVLEV
ncbi:MAG: Mrp/NBP35 family ATP-binding protein [Planctomycetes bacterium]|nr:Mrp/NBP35 family ATP-binding protein [Planctomycetota bacterium]